ncbi:mid region of cactin domain-containing protein [Trichoderma ceciliae]
MDPGRRAMIADSRASSSSSGRREPTREPTAARSDSNNRVSKASRPGPSTTARHAARYLSQDEQSRQFVADEDKFVLKQAKKKADIRVREGRAKPIDVLAFNLRFVDADRDVFDADDADDDIEVAAPIKVIHDLSSAAQISELDSNIVSYHVLETDSRNRRYWEALRTLCADRRAKLDPQGHEGRVVSSVADDIDKILAPKTFDQLEALEQQIKAKLRSNEDIDTDYWEQLLRSLRVWKAKATLARIADDIDAKKRERLAKRAPRPKESSGSSGLPGGSSSGSSHSSSHDSGGALASTNKVDALAFETGNADDSQATMALYDREAARGVSENEEVFAAEEALPGSSKPPQWTDKYQARKPRYFNRVQMGYEWNKYNQTHYDHDNPPPKVVQGYKFNIFYPDLIDKTKAPTFKIIREHGRRRGESFAAAGEVDTCLIRFIAGPPYEDLAFRIVDREWDYSAKKERGFRSSFDKVCRPPCSHYPVCFSCHCLGHAGSPSLTDLARFG